MKLRKPISRILILLTVYISSTSSLYVIASQSSGTIPDTARITKICQNNDCSAYGHVNWKPTLNANTTGATPITITDTGIDGWLWGDQIGWVNMQPTGAGVTLNPDTGKLSGYAYSSVGSWVNFAPTTVSGGTDVGVTIDSNGQFTGWAYVSGVYGGWMKFDCSDSSTCIETDWRPVSARTTSPASTQTPVSSSGLSYSSSGGYNYNTLPNTLVINPTPSNIANGDVLNVRTNNNDIGTNTIMNNSGGGVAGSEKQNQTATRAQSSLSGDMNDINSKDKVVHDAPTVSTPITKVATVILLIIVILFIVKVVI